MRLHHIRNATCIIESSEHFILIDPMLSHQGELPPFSLFKHKAKKNPIVPLPLQAAGLLDKVTDCLITHSQTFGLKILQHTDHLDKRGEAFLISKNIPVVSVEKDVAYLKKQHLNVVDGLVFWEKKPYLNGHIMAIPAQHGYGWIHRYMANGAGYFIELANEPSVYICGDTILTADVRKAIVELKPDVVILAAGNASLDVGGDLLMNMHDILEVIRISPNKVIANHMDALNHCGISRKALKIALEKENVLHKVWILEDGESIELSNEAKRA